MLVKRNGRRSKLISKSFCFENHERFTQQKKILFSDSHRCVIITKTKLDSKLSVFRRALGKASWMVEIIVYFTNIKESLLLD